MTSACPRLPTHMAPIINMHASLRKVGHAAFHTPDKNRSKFKTVPPARNNPESTVSERILRKLAHCSGSGHCPSSTDLTFDTCVVELRMDLLDEIFRAATPAHENPLIEEVRSKKFVTLGLSG